MKKTSALIIIILILIIILAIKIDKSEKNVKPQKINNAIYKTNNEITNTRKTENNNKVEIISHKKNMYSIDVIIKNNTGRKLNQVIVKAECYDKDGNNLGIKSNGGYEINTKDNYKISIYIDSATYKYNLKLEYK